MSTTLNEFRSKVERESVKLSVKDDDDESKLSGTTAL